VCRSEVWNDKTVVAKLYSLFMGNIPTKSQVSRCLFDTLPSTFSRAQLIVLCIIILVGLYIHLSIFFCLCCVFWTEFSKASTQAQYARLRCPSQVNVLFAAFIGSC